MAELSPAKKALVKSCLEDGWSQVEIYRTHRIHTRTIRRHFPGSGWTLKEGSKLGMAVRRAGVRV